MKLAFHHAGRQFFFITLVVAERQCVLSRIIDETGKPELTRLGEIVRFGLRAIHRVWPAATVSDSVIMPDHLHFLLIVDYGKDAAFSPLFTAHRLADAVESIAERTGAAAPAPLLRNTDVPLNREDQKTEDERNIAIMADALTEARNIANEAALRGQLHKTNGLHFGEKPLPSPGYLSSGGGSGAKAPVRSVVFARDCYIELSFDSRQLKAVRHYIRLNPARWIWKQQHPDRFACQRNIRSTRLSIFAPRTFDGLGNLALLGSPFLFHVRLTLRKTLAEHEQSIAEIVERAKRGWIPVSGFLSPGEKETLRRLKAEPGTRFIKLLPSTLPDRYDPSTEDSREIAAGRMAILSTVPAVPLSSLAIKTDPAAARDFRRNCLEMNEIAAKICETIPAPVPKTFH